MLIFRIREPRASRTCPSHPGKCPLTSGSTRTVVWRDWYASIYDRERPRMTGESERRFGPGSASVMKQLSSVDW